MMRPPRTVFLFKLVLAAQLLVLPLTAAGAGWQRAQWNMSPEQVAQATGGQARLSRGSGGDRLGGKRVGNVGTYSIGRSRFRTVYYYDSNGLALISLQRRSGDCREILQSIVSEHGQPLLVSDQLILRLLIWHDREAANRIRLMVSRNICDIHYERLSDYEAIDRARLGPGAEPASD